MASARDDETALIYIFRSNSTLISPAFWAIVDTLRDPYVYEHLVTDISQCYSPQSGQYDITSILKTPLVQSVQSEIKRLRLATVVTHANALDGFQLDEHWTLSRDSIATFFSHDFSMNKELWAKARPRTVERPLEDFWAERFLVPDKARPSTKNEKKKRKMLGNSAWMAWSFGT